MKTSNLLTIVFSLIFLLLPLSGFTESADIGDPQTMDVACRYEIKAVPYAKSMLPQKNAWFFWRKPGMIQTLDASGDYGEIWEQTANGSIQYRKLYHADKTAVEYMPADMPVNNMSFDWLQLSGMLSLQELDELKLVKNTQVFGRKAELRKGIINGQTIEVIWLPAKKLPASIIKKDKKGRVELRLVEISPLPSARRKPIAIEEIANYRHIDAADFGDMENDPFVKKLMAAEGHHH